jgi:hypothetical protein
MRFIDPFDFFQVESPSQVDAAFLQRLRRKMLAEFELREDSLGSGFVDWKGRAVSKTEVLNLLDAFEEEGKRGWYWKVRGIKGLVEYLAGNDPKLIQKIRLDGFQKAANADPGLHAFCSPFVAETFNGQLGGALEGRKWDVASMLLKYVPLMAVQDLDAGFKLAIRHVRARILYLEDAALMDRDELKAFQFAPFIVQDFLIVLNMFPGHFQQLRNAYAIALRKLAVAMSEHKTLLAQAVDVIEAAVLVGVDAHIARENRLYLQQILMKKVLSFEMPPMPGSGRKAAVEEEEVGDSVDGRERKTGVGNAGVFFFIIIVLIAIGAAMRGGGGGSSYQPYDFKMPTFNYKIPEFDFKDFRSYTDHGDEPFYDSLLLHHLRNPDFVEEGRRPSTGSNPYAAFFRVLAGVKSASIEAPIRLVNRSKRDIVVFVEEGIPSKIATTVYVRSGATVDGITLEEGFYDFALYDGVDWQDSVATYKGIPIGGFASDVHFIGQKVVRDDGDAPDPARVSSVFVLEREPHELVFDGKTFEEVNREK